MYWPLEESASTVPTSAISGGSEVGDECEVKINKHKYSGRVAAKGKLISVLYSKHTHLYYSHYI